MGVAHLRCRPSASVKPRYVIPIHDWFLSEGGKTFMYRLAEMALSADGIELVQIEDFTTTTLSV